MTIYGVSSKTYDYSMPADQTAVTADPAAVGGGASDYSGQTPPAGGAGAGVAPPAGGGTVDPGQAGRIAAAVEQIMASAGTDSFEALGRAMIVAAGHSWQSQSEQRQLEQKNSLNFTLQQSADQHSAANAMQTGAAAELGGGLATSAAGLAGSGIGVARAFKAPETELPGEEPAPALQLSASVRGLEPPDTSFTGKAATILTSISHGAELGGAGTTFAGHMYDAQAQSDKADSTADEAQATNAQGQTDQANTTGQHLFDFMASIQSAIQSMQDAQAEGQQALARA